MEQTLLTCKLSVTADRLVTVRVSVMNSMPSAMKYKENNIYKYCVSRIRPPSRCL